MHVKAIIPYFGPSMFAPCAAIRLDIAADPGLDKIASQVPGLAEYVAECSRQLPPPYRSVQWAQMPLPDFIGKLASMLHSTALPVADWSTTFHVKSDDLVRILFACSDSTFGVVAAHTAFLWVASFVARKEGQPLPLPPTAEALARFGAETMRYNLGANGRLIIAEALRRNIPFTRARGGDMTALLGYGHRQQRLRETLLGSQSKIAADLSQNKRTANELLAIAGLPVPRQILVNNWDSAERAAKQIGFPVVVKPVAGSQGNAVHVNIRDLQTLKTSYSDAARNGEVLVEQHVNGADYRILVVGGRMVAAAQRIPAFVVGDGKRTVRELIAEENRNPRRIDGYLPHFLCKIKIDQDLLDHLSYQKLDLDQIAPQGLAIRLHSAANISSGGVARDATSRVHPDNRDMAIRATRVLGLDMAGVDLLSPDISRSYREFGGAICEVNAIPGLRAHLSASSSPDVVGAIVDHLFPNGSNGRIPIVAITGTNGKTTTSRMVASMLRQAGHCVGAATTDGVTIDGAEIAVGDLAGIPGAMMLLNDPAVTAAVLETARGGLIRRGLAMDACDVAAVLNVRDDHLGSDGIDSREDMARVKSIVATSARKALVLNADDVLCMQMAQSSRAEELWWFAETSDNPVVQEHIARGLNAVTLAGAGEAQRIVHWHETKMQAIADVSRIPCTFGGRAKFNVANALAATAVCLAQGLKREFVAQALYGFSADPSMSRGRCNFVDGLPFRVLVDYAHNPDGVASMCRFLATEPVHGKRWLVLTSRGNRQESHFRQMAQAAAGSFDRYICATSDPRNRTVEEVLSLLSQGLVAAGVDPQTIERAQSEAEAIDRATGQAQPGDLIVTFVARSTAALAQLDRLRLSRATSESSA